MTNTVLLIDDQIGDLMWLVQILEDRGYEVELATNAAVARTRLEEVARGEKAYRLAIVDVMLALADIRDLDSVDDTFFTDSMTAGLKLCEYARRELKLTPDQLPIVCCTVRDDVDDELEELGILRFQRELITGPKSLREYVEKHLDDLRGK